MKHVCNPQSPLKLGKRKDSFWLVDI